MSKDINEVIECTSEEGITIGLIDSMIACANGIAGRDLTHPKVVEAIKDLRSSMNVRVLLSRVMGVTRPPLIKTYEIAALEKEMMPR